LTQILQILSSGESGFRQFTANPCLHTILVDTPALNDCFPLPLRYLIPADIKGFCNYNFMGGFIAALEKSFSCILSGRACRNQYKFGSGVEEVMKPVPVILSAANNFLL